MNRKMKQNLTVRIYDKNYYYMDDNKINDRFKNLIYRNVIFNDMLEKETNLKTKYNENISMNYEDNKNYSYDKASEHRRYIAYKTAMRKLDNQDFNYFDLKINNENDNDRKWKLIKFFNKKKKKKRSNVKKTEKINIIEEIDNNIINRRMSNKLIEPHYYFTARYNERSKPSQIKHWTSSTYSFLNNDKIGNNFLDKYTTKLINLFFSVKYLKKKMVWDIKWIEGFKILPDNTLMKDLNTVINHTSNRTGLLIRKARVYTPIIFTWDWVKNQISQSIILARNIRQRSAEYLTGYYPKKKSYIRRLNQIMLSKPLFKHTSFNLLIDIFLYNNKRYKFRMLKNISLRRSLYKYMYSMYVNTHEKIKETINRPRFFYINIIEPNRYNYYRWIIYSYELLFIKKKNSLFVYICLLLLQLNNEKKNKLNSLKNKVLNSIENIKIFDRIFPSSNEKVENGFVNTANQIEKINVDNDNINLKNKKPAELNELNNEIYLIKSSNAFKRLKVKRQNSKKIKGNQYNNNLLNWFNKKREIYTIDKVLLDDITGISDLEDSKKTNKTAKERKPMLLKYKKYIKNGDFNGRGSADDNIPLYTDKKDSVWRELELLEEKRKKRLKKIERKKRKKKYTFNPELEKKNRERLIESIMKSQDTMKRKKHKIFLLQKRRTKKIMKALGFSMDDLIIYNERKKELGREGMKKEAKEKKMAFFKEINKKNKKDPANKTKYIIAIRIKKELDDQVKKINPNKFNNDRIVILKQKEKYKHKLTDDEIEFYNRLANYRNSKGKIENNKNTIIEDYLYLIEAEKPQIKQYESKVAILTKDDGTTMKEMSRSFFNKEAWVDEDLKLVKKSKEEEKTISLTERKEIINMESSTNTKKNKNIKVKSSSIKGKVIKKSSLPPYKGRESLGWKRSSAQGANDLFLSDIAKKKGNLELEELNLLISIREDEINRKKSSINKKNKVKVLDLALPPRIKSEYEYLMNKSNQTLETNPTWSSVSKLISNMSINKNKKGKKITLLNLLYGSILNNKKRKKKLVKKRYLLKIKKNKKKTLNNININIWSIPSMMEMAKTRLNKKERNTILNIKGNDSCYNSGMIWDKIDYSILSLLYKYFNKNKNAVVVKWGDINSIFNGINKFKGFGNIWYIFYLLGKIKKEYFNINKEVLISKEYQILPYSINNFNKTYKLNMNMDEGDEISDTLNFDKEKFNVKYWEGYYENKRNSNLGSKLGYNENIFKPYYRYLIPYFLFKSYNNILSYMKMRKLGLNTNNSILNKLNGILENKFMLYNFLTVKILLDLFHYNYRSILRIKPKYYYINKLRLYKTKFKKLNINNWIASIRFIRKLRKTPANFWFRYHWAASHYYNRIAENATLDTKRKIFVPFVLYFEDILYNIYGKWVIIRLWPLKRYYLSSFILAERVLSLILWRSKRQIKKINFQKITSKLISGIRILQIKKAYDYYINNSSRWPSDLINKMKENKSYGILNYTNLEFFQNIEDRSHVLNTYILPNDTLSSYLLTDNKNYLVDFKNNIDLIKNWKMKRNIRKKNITNLQFIYYWLRPLKNYILKLNRSFDISGIKMRIKGRGGVRRNNLRSTFKTRFYGSFLGPSHSTIKLLKAKTISTPRLRGYIKSNIDCAYKVSKSKNGAISFKVWMSSLISTDMHELLLHLTHIKTLYDQLMYRYYNVDPYLKLFKHNQAIIPSKNIVTKKKRKKF